MSLRVNPDVDFPTSHTYTRTGHAASTFGIPEEEAEALHLAHRVDARLRFRGIDEHIGSPIVDTDP